MTKEPKITIRYLPMVRSQSDALTPDQVWMQVNEKQNLREELNEAISDRNNAQRLASKRGNELAEARATLSTMYAEWSLYRNALIQLDACLGYPSDKNLAEALRTAEECAPNCSQGPSEVTGACDRLCCRKTGERP